MTRRASLDTLGAADQTYALSVTPPWVSAQDEDGAARAILGDESPRRRSEDHESLVPRVSASWADADGPWGALDNTKIWDYSPNLERIQRGQET
jgi:hypothetical protein